MEKLSEKKYQAILQAKQIVAGLDDAGKLEWVEQSLQIARTTVITRSSALMKQALLTVLLSGTMSNNGYSMPATAVCCENFKLTKKQMKRNSLSAYIYDPGHPRADEDGYFEMPLFAEY